jgi:glyoxylase-like metal-dependent hydrolase (beta-lactamase superfamily II)
MGLYLRQLLAAEDFCRDDVFAAQMANFVYLVGDDQSRECLIVDPAWDIPGIVAAAEADGMTVTGALVTHYHPDHIGGHFFGHDVSGLADLLSARPIKIHVNQEEAEGVKLVTGVSESDLERHAGGDQITVGEIRITLLHTPGHTPGSQCFLTEGCLVSGDTLFIGGCGRVDLPGSDPDQMYYSLTQVLAKLPDDVRLFPGHNYAYKREGTIGEEKRKNPYILMRSLDDWRQMMGRG